MRHRRTTNEIRCSPNGEHDFDDGNGETFERLQSLEQKINEVDKIQTIENYIAQLKERIWAVKEVLTTAEASAYLGCPRVISTNSLLSSKYHTTSQTANWYISTERNFANGQ